MRIRSTKPEFWRSKTIAEFDFFDRLVLKALEAYVDDNGVGKDSVVMLCADAFPHDLAKSPEICAKVSGSLSRFAEGNLIVRYTFAGEPLIYVRQWKRWQYIDKPKAGRYPRPDGTMNYRDNVDETIVAGQVVSSTVIRDDYPEPPEDFAKTSRKPPEECPQIQSGEQGNRGTGEQLKEDPPQAAATPSKRGHRLPANWMPPDDVIAAMKAECPNVDLETEHRKFVDYWTDKTGKDATKIDWTGTWRNWIRRAADRTAARPKPQNVHKLRATANLAAEERAREQAAQKELA